MRARLTPLSGLAAASIVIAGPALLIFARSDLGRWSSFLERALLSVPLGVFASITFSYAVVTLLFEDGRDNKKIALGVSGSLVIPLLSYAVAFPIFFGLGEAGAYITAGILFVLLSLPTALFQAIVVADHGSRAHLFGACVVAATISLFVYAWPSVGWSSGTRAPDPYATHIFDGAVYLLSAIPHATLACFKTKPLPLSRLAIVLAVVLAPTYSLKVLADIHRGHYARAPLWPAYVFTDFVSWSDRVETNKEMMARVRGGLPVPVGERWYRFDGVLNVNISPYGLSRDSQRVEYIQIVVPAPTVGLENVLSSGRHAILNVSALRSSTGDNPSPLVVTERYEDLTISMSFMRGDRFDPAEIRARLRQFLNEAKTTPPPT